jgi:sec-independent protein translocase protein TatB
VFDFAWSEIALIGIVALIAIGPKDMPVAIKAVAGMIKKARRMAAEFQTHVDELVREADLHEVRDQFRQIRNFDFRGEITKAVDPDGSIRSTLTTDPLKTPTTGATPMPEATPSALEETRVMERPENTILPSDTPPAFIPPADVAAHEPPPPFPAAPAFIPPEYLPPHS